MSAYQSPKLPGVLGLGILALTFLAVGRLSAQEAPALLPAEPAPAQVGEGILIDGIHANDLATEGLGPEIYNYHQTCGSRRSFEYLRSQGVGWGRVTDGILTPQMLSRFRMLFINLVSAERPPFLVSEIAAIRAFVEAGGSLLVIVDHSNCYYHAHHLLPLFTELDMAIFTDTACDLPPNTLDDGNVWLSITRFRRHPVTEGLKRLGMQTGGRVDPRFAVAMTSSRAWADLWYTDPFGHRNGPGFYGNLVRDEGEISGTMGVVAAKTLGRGRIVVIADQNMIGETFLHFADNYRLWLNAVAWLLDKPALRDPEAYCRWRQPRIVMYEPLARSGFSRDEKDGVYFLYGLASRYWWTFVSDRWVEPCDLLVFGFNQCVLPAEDLEAVVRHLRGGRNVLILNTESALLWDELGVVSQVLKALNVEKPAQQTRNGQLVLELPGCGSLYLMPPDEWLDNGKLAPVMEVPTEAQRQQGQRLLDAIHAALPPSNEPAPRFFPDPKGAAEAGS